LDGLTLVTAAVLTNPLSHCFLLHINYNRMNFVIAFVDDDAIERTKNKQANKQMKRELLG